MSAISSIGSTSSAQIYSLLAQLRANSDADSSTTSDSSTSSLVSLFNTTGVGSSQASALTSTFSQLSGLTQSALLGLQEQSGHGPGAGGRPPERPDGDELFAKLDTDGDGSVTKEEFLAGKPDDVTDEQAEAFWEQLAGEDTDSLTQDEFVTAFDEQGPPPPPGAPPSADELFAKLDSDEDGTVTKEEFLANQPEGVSEDEALERWTALAGEDADSLSEDDFKTALKDLPPPPPPGGGQGGGYASSDSSDDQQALISQLLTALQSYQSSAYQSNTTSSLLSSLFV